MNEIIVGRHIEGSVLLCGKLHYLAVLVKQIFQVVQGAVRYLKEHGADDEEIYYMNFIYTNESRECKCHLCEKRDDCYVRDKFQRLPRNPDGTGGLGMCPKL